MFSPARKLALVLLLTAGALSSLGAQSPASRARIALFEPAGGKGDAALTAVLTTVADSVELSLDVLQRYEVRRLPPADPEKDLARVKAYCQDDRIDQAIMGSGSAKAEGGYLFKLVVYDRRSDAITLAPEGSSVGALDMFDVTDKLVGTLLDGLSGTHVLFGSLSVETDPAGAAVSVNGKEVGAAPVSLRGLPAGAVQVNVKLAGYEDTNTSVTIMDGESTDTPLKLTRSTGTLAFTVPNDAAVSVSSAEIGQKDYTGSSTATLPTGDYDFRAASPGLPAVTSKETVNRSARTQYLPWPKGYLDVQATPAGATIVVDGVERGVAPLVVDVDPATPHHIQLRHDKYETYATDVSAAAGDKTPLAAALVGLPGSIRVEAVLPAGASVKTVEATLDDGDRSAAMPAVFDNVQPGAHVLNVDDIRVGNRIYTVGSPIQVQVQPGETTQVSKTYVEGTAFLTIKNAPDASTVTINGNTADSGKALTTGVEIPAGTNDVIVQAPGGQKWSTSLTVSPDAKSEKSIYEMTAVLPRRTITMKGSAEDWAGVLPLWPDGQNYNTYAGQPGTKIAKGFACRDDNYLYIRYDFSDGSPRPQLSAAVQQGLRYSAFLYTGRKGDEIQAYINIARGGIGGWSVTTTVGVSNSSAKSWTSLGDRLLVYKIGENMLELALPLDVIKRRLVPGATEAALFVSNTDKSGKWLTSNSTRRISIDLGP